MPRRTKDQINKDNRKILIVDALSISEAPPEINWIIATYTVESEIVDAEIIREMQHWNETLFRCFKRVFLARAKIKTFQERFTYHQLLTDTEKNWMQYQGRLFSEPWCHKILLDKYKEAFNFMNAQIDRSLEPSIEGPLAPWEVLLIQALPEYYSQ